MTVTHSKIPARLKRQRGVATILVISSLLVLTLIGFALITIVQFQKMSATAAGSAQSRSSNADIVTKAITDKLQDDLTRTYRGIRSDEAIATATNIPDAYSYNDITYPGVAHKWLSSLVPYDTDPTVDTPLDAYGNGDGDSDKNNDFNAWRQIAFFGTNPSTEYIDITTGTSYTSPLTPTQANLAYKSVNDPSVNLNRDADTDGDGFVDARYMLLKTPQSDELVWTYAVRIVDNSGQLNVNTWANSYGATEAPTGQTPSDICFDYTMFAADGTAATWGTAFTATDFRAGGTPGSANWLAFYNAKGIAAIPDTVANRLNYWTSFAGLQNQAFRIYPNTAPLAGATPIGLADEAELRFKAGQNLSSRSFLENTIDKSTVTLAGASNSGPLRSYFPESFTATARSNRADIRRLITAINGTHAVKVPTIMCETNAALGEYREPMPLWLSELNAGDPAPSYTVLAPKTTAGSSFTPPSGIPFFKLNPNTDHPTWLGYLFDNLLRQNTTIGTRYSITGTVDYPDATNTAYGLAANLYRYRSTYSVSDAQAYDPTQAQVTSTASPAITYYGLTLQPFFTQVVYGETFADTNGNNKIDGNEMPAPAGSANPNQRFVAIEIRNPWPVPIDLSKFAIRYNGVSANDVDIAASVTWLDPGDYRLILTNDSKWYTTIDTASTPVAKQIRVSTNALLPLATLGNGTFEMVHKTSSVIVDRMASTDANWPRPPFTKNVATPVDYSAAGNYVMSANKLERWWAPDAAVPTSTTAAGNGYAQSYMLENPNPTNGNFGPLPGTDTGALTLGTWREIASADASFTSQYGTYINAELGNSDPNTPSTAHAKTGKNVTGFTWPKFQIDLPFNTTVSPNTIGAPLYTVGEVLNIITVAHSNNAGVYTTFGENLFKRYNAVAASPTVPGLGSQPPLLNYGQFNTGHFYNGTDYTTHNVNRATYPFVPVALTIPAALDIVTSNTNQPFVAGRLNINTASTEATEALPYLYRTMPSGLGLPTPYLGSRGIVAFRDLTNLSGIGSGGSPNNIPGPNYTNRSTATGMTSIRGDGGFALPSELLLVRSTNVADVNYVINAAAVDGASTPTGATETSTDQIIDDTEEDTSVYTKLSSIVSTRSDVFTAYVIMKGQKYNKTTSLYETVSTIRYVATMLRGTVLASGIDGSIGSPASGAYPLTFSATALPTGYDAGYLVGRDVLMRRRTSTSTAGATVHTIAAKIKSATSSGGVVTAQIVISTGAYATDATSSLPSPADWEFQVIDNPRVLSFTQARQ